MKVLFFAFSRSSLGHVSRMCAAASYFERAGHTVLIASHEEVRGVIEGHNLPFRAIREIAPALEWRGITDDEALREFVRGRQASREYVERSLEDEISAIESFRPDVVISDMRNTACVAAYMNRVPSFSIHSLRLFDHPMNIIVPEVMRTLGSLGIAEDASVKVLGDSMMVPDVGSLNSLRGLRPDVSALITQLVSEVRYIGPVVNVPDLLRIGERTAGGRPTLLVSLGGNGAGLADIEKVISECANLDVRISIVCGIKGDVPSVLRERVELLRGTADIEVRAFSHTLAMDIAQSSVLITHGGHSTIQQALLAGTPMVVLPHAPEQLGNARQVADLGLATLVVADEHDGAVERGVRESLSSSRRLRSESFASALRSINGAEEMLSYVSSRMHLCGY